MARMKMVCFKMEPEMTQRVKRLYRRGRNRSQGEFMRDAIRDRCEQVEKCGKEMDLAAS